MRYEVAPELTTSREPTGARYGSDVAADVLGSLGLRYLPLTPGASFRGLHDSVVNHHGNRTPQVILCLHEMVAVGVAHSYAKAARQVTPVALHDLVGLMNAQMAIYNIWIDRASLMIIGGGGPRDPASRRPIEWAHSAPAQAELVRPFVKHEEEPYSPQELAEALARCYRASASAPHGPSYVTLDVNLQESELREPVDLSMVPTAAQPFARLMPDPAAVQRAARLLREAELPVIVAGRTGLDPLATPLLVELARSLGAAGVDERNFVTFPTDHPLNLTADRSILADADVVFAVDNADLRSTVAAAAPTARLISCGLDPLVHRSLGNFGRAQPPVDVEVVADPIATIQDLLEQLRRKPPATVDRETRSRRLAERRVAAQRAVLDAAQGRRGPGTAIGAWTLVQEVWEAVEPHPWLLAERNGRSWPEGLWKFAGAGQYLGHSGGGGVGHGPGAAVGGALAAVERDELAVAILGDGDLGMMPAALWTAAHYRLPLLVVVNNNRSFWNDEAHQQRIARVRARPEENAWVGTRIEDPAVDFAAVARGMGVRGSGPVEGCGQLREELRAAVEYVTSGGGPALVDVVTTRGGRS